MHVVVWTIVDNSHIHVPLPFENLTYSCFIISSLQALFGLIAVQNSLKNFYETLNESSKSLLQASKTSRDILRNQNFSDDARLSFTYSTAMHDKSNTSMEPFAITGKYYTPHVQEDAAEFLVGVQKLFHNCGLL